MKSVAKGLLIGMATFGLAMSGVATATSIGSEPIAVYATLEDDLGGTPVQNNQGSQNTQEDLGNALRNQQISEDDKSVADWIKNQRGMSGEQLNKASQTLSPITNLIGYVVGAAVALIFTGIFAITALDLLYIAIPPIRGFLYKAGTDGTGAYTGGMPGGGYQRGYGYGGAGGASGGTAKPTQWISDEAVACAAMIGGSAQATGNMGPVGGPGGNPQNVPIKSVIGTYFKKRISFLIVLVVSAIVLTSSVLLGTGVNLAQWVLKLIELLNSYIPA